MGLVTAAVIGLVGAGVGAASSAATNKSNRGLADQANADEKDRRAAAAKEADRLIEEYNELRGERPDVSIQAFLKDKIYALNNENARKAFEKATEKDFEKAQYLADEASKSNVSIYNTLLENVSGGAAADAIKKRNEIAFSTNELDAFNRAMQLRSPTIPAGTVRLDSQGRFVEGQRSDKQTFQTAFEVGEQQRALQFDRLSSLLGTDRDVALRQQQKALEFLPATSYTNVALGTVGESRAAQQAYQLLDEANQFSLIQGFLGAAFKDQTATPAFQSTAGSDALTAKGLELAVNAIAQNKQNTGSSPQSGQLSSRGY